MAFEIELKAWVDDRKAVEKRAGELAEFTADFEKEDVYWVPVSRSGMGGGALLSGSGVRIRRETLKAQGAAARSHVLVTYKTKEVRGGVEVNDEKEFTVTGLPAFEELLRRMGFEAGISKKKRGRSWRYGGGADGITVEISDVERLGCFMELEIMAGDNGANTVNAAREKLLSFLKLAGIGEDRIETRYYNEMLKEAAGN
ncbi:MAG: class IV adenylate cyclase [Spirochaetaceae bacterium]|jgi:adenylate cyclase class 2|nr:class IV adenylate cyclase [Spirochaetaceae bacterium]